MDVYVIRHTPVNVAQGICYGQTDVPLADTFAADAEVFRQTLPDRFRDVYTSPLQRCRSLAAMFSEQPIVSDQLIEMDFGDWENMAWEEMDQPALFNWMADPVTLRTPNGENLEMLYQRIAHFLDHLPIREDGPILIVTHAGPIRCIWGALLEIPLRNLMKLPVGFGEVFGFHWSEDPAYRRIFQT